MSLITSYLYLSAISLGPHNIIFFILVSLFPLRGRSESRWSIGAGVSRVCAITSGDQQPDTQLDVHKIVRATSKDCLVIVLRVYGRQLWATVSFLTGLSNMIVRKWHQQFKQHGLDIMIDRSSLPQCISRFSLVYRVKYAYRLSRDHHLSLWSCCMTVSLSRMMKRPCLRWQGCSRGPKPQSEFKIDDINTLTIQSFCDWTTNIWPTSSVHATTSLVTATGIATESATNSSTWPSTTNSTWPTSWSTPMKWISPPGVFCKATTPAKHSPRRSAETEFSKTVAKTSSAFSANQSPNWALSTSQLGPTGNRLMERPRASSVHWSGSMLKLGHTTFPEAETRCRLAALTATIKQESREPCPTKRKQSDSRAAIMS